MKITNVDHQLGFVGAEETTHWTKMKDISFCHLWSFYFGELFLTLGTFGLLVIVLVCLLLPCFSLLLGCLLLWRFVLYKSLFMNNVAHILYLLLILPFCLLGSPLLFMRLQVLLF